jgi:hypothetical protein
MRLMTWRVLSISPYILEVFEETVSQRGTDDDELAYKLRTVRSIILSGKAGRCATIGQYQDLV